ncbi:EboA domain-containing protein [Croceitalea rosinachiae]|uniref:EboA domain-containing protein n=1 Tax=Croceitalea rosinachiae TaxID=3075596 RepID=A0ABU3AHX6_9FLAO|nr:EboA domain-containing protein [Croceitalea sp. F388]MDT0608506.1 EboA domain-containing protein [Croceitalea sp. F388]
MRSDITSILEATLTDNSEPKIKSWLDEKLELILTQKSARQLYLTYSLIGTKFPRGLIIENLRNPINSFLVQQKPSLIQVARIFLLSKVLIEEESFFMPKIQNLIQVADTGELETFLKYLVLLPNSENYHFAAVEALRTNISSVFEAIAMNNPYPAEYFTDQEWNQMYLKAAFMQLDLGKIMAVDKRANKQLARIISDYAHERWAASRNIDPLFWRPTSNFLEGKLISDVNRLLNSDNENEVKAGALVCYNSDLETGKKILNDFPDDLVEKVRSNVISWENLKN